MVVFLAVLSEYAGVMAPLIGQERRYDGPMGKSDRAFWFSLIAVLVSFSPYLVKNNYTNSITYICNGLLIFIAALLVLTTYNRIKNSIQL